MEFLCLNMARLLRSASLRLFSLSSDDIRNFRIINCFSYRIEKQLHMKSERDHYFYMTYVFLQLVFLEGTFVHLIL